MKDLKKVTKENDVKLLNAANTQAAKTPISPENEPPVIQAVVIPTAEQRLKSAEELRILGENYSTIKVKQDELKKFALSSDDTQEKISLTNSKGYSFTTSNTDVTKEVAGLIEKVLGKKAEELERKILEYSI